ncbi:hypothetical protein Q5P01_018950 [Channa striata]|uniref:Uncharacterized protein n=1 Tax=Channa striata TaxID=64152 RepID=A0AA88M051_CHASR|nr:hypothetical protein Q5P01_018950 [Channa striata]
MDEKQKTRPSVQFSPGPPPFCPRAPRPREEFRYVCPETPCYWPAAPQHVSPPPEVSLRQQENEGEEQLRVRLQNPGPICRLPAPDPGLCCPMDPSPVLLDVTTSEEKDLEAEGEKQS